MPFSRGVRLHGKSPHVVHVRNSYPILVRDGILARIKAMSFFTGFSFRSNVALQVQPDDIPFCGVYLLNEQGTSDGDPNAGEVRFRTVAHIGISVIIQNNDSVVAERTLDAASQVLMTNLFSDHTLYDNSVFKIQAFTNLTRTHVFGNMVKDNETPIAELRIEVSCDLGTVTYPPYVPDDLEVIHVQTRFPVGGTAQQIHDTLQVVASYDLEQGS